MASTDLTIDATRIAGRVTMNVTIEQARSYRFRISLGIWLMRLAAYVIGCNIKVTTDVDA